MVTKWRPSEYNCLYVIPDIHGNFDGLQRILNRILPLRKSDGGQDKLVFLGDYIDRHIDSPKVLDLLIQIKGEDPENISFIKGNHEELLLLGLKFEEADDLRQQANFRCWYDNGGDKTILGYLYRKNMMDLFPSSLSFQEIKELIPQEHVDFIKSCQDYVTIDNYIFVHGGFNPFVPLENHDPNVFYWDRKLFDYVKKKIREKQPLGWEPVSIICGHSGPNILIHDNYMMLDSGSPKELLIAELRSKEAGVLEYGKKRMVMKKLENTVLKPAAFQRVQDV